jgi:hypothetical protein
VHVIEIFLPLQRNDGSPQPSAVFSEVRAELVERFGGLTAFTRAPAEGLWEADAGAVERDQIVIFEVVADALERDWWRDYRLLLERRFEQEAVLVRAHAVERL